MSASAKQTEISVELRDALKFALRKLRSSDRLKSEIQEHLLSKGVDGGVIFEAIAFLEKRRILNDARAISNLTERSAERGEGRRKLLARLIARGLDESTAELIASNRTDHEEFDLAIEQCKQFHREEVDRERSLRKLVSKGFETDIAKSAVEAVYRDSPESSWDDH